MAMYSNSLVGVHLSTFVVVVPVFWKGEESDIQDTTDIWWCAWDFRHSS